MVLAAVLVLPILSGHARGQSSHLNPLLLEQKAGTWLRLPPGSGPTPRIHDHAGGVIDPESSILHFFGSDTHGEEWNNEVWSYDVVTMRWSQSYPEDPPATYRYLDGRKTTTTGRPWAMHTFAMTAWETAGRRLVVGAWQMHYQLDSLPHVKVPVGSGESWWQYAPASGTWTAAVPSPHLGLGHLCYVAPLKRVVGFNEENRPITLYDPERRAFERFTALGGPLPAGYTLKSVYDPRRGRILLVSKDPGPNVWAFDLSRKRWTNLRVTNRPPGNIYGSWDYDPSADVIVSLWPDDPGGGFDNPSGRSRTFLVDLARNVYREVSVDPSPPYTGMSYRVLYDPRHQVTLAVEGGTVWSFKAPPLAADGGL
jgi:hypothetical protein